MVRQNSKPICFSCKDSDNRYNLQPHHPDREFARFQGYPSLSSNPLLALRAKAMTYHSQAHIVPSLAADPFVAPAAYEKNTPKSVGEILAAMNGCRVSDTRLKAEQLADNFGHSLQKSFDDLDRLDAELCSLVTSEDRSSLQAEPIRCGYEHDPDYFDLYSVAERQQLAGLERAQSTEQNLPANSSVASVDQKSESLHQPRDTQAGVIWARSNEVIYVDGKNGYEYIDLTCIDLLQASFEANRIRVRTENHCFEIDYRNVSYAVFAGDQRVELAAFETDFAPSMLLQ